MEVDNVSADIAETKRKLSTEGAPKEETPLCNGDSKKANGVNGEESHSSMEDDEKSSDSAPSANNHSVNGKGDNGVNGKAEGKGGVSVMEIDDDDSSDSSSSAKKSKNSKSSDVDETSQDSVLSGSADQASKSNNDSDCEMIDDDDDAQNKVEKKEKVKNEENKDSKNEKDVEKKEPENKDAKDKKEVPKTENNETKEKSLANLDPSMIETKAEAAARLKAEAMNKAKFAVMEEPPEILDMRPMAHLLHDIGMDLCRETVYSHLIKVQNKKLTKKKLNDKETEQLDKLKEVHVEIKKKNDAFTQDVNKCPICSFKTESKNVLEWHLEFAHGQDQESYACSFCNYTTKLPGVFFYHMENEHKRKGRIYMRSAQFSCPLCPFENNKRATMNKHRMRCEKAFSTRRNLEPSPTDCDIPLKRTKKQLAAAAAATQNQGRKPAIITRANPPPLQPKPLGSSLISTGGGTVAQTISQAVQGGKPYNSNSIQLAAQAIAQQAAQNVLKQQKKAAAPIPLSGQIPGGMIPMYPPGTTQAQILAGTIRPTHYAIGNQLYQIVQTRGQFMLQPVQQSSNIQIRQAAKTGQARPTPQQKAEIDLKSALEAVQKNVERKQAEERRRKEMMTKGKGNAFEICEICGGFVKDRDSLHIHFFWAHKVEINKEVFQQHQPHLVCEVCKSRFWTFQGLHRHRQMSHGGKGGGSAQASAAAGKPNPTLYKCYVCGEFVAYLATHLSEKHNVSIQQMFKAKKCYVCGLSFDNQKALEKHLVRNHRELLTPQKFKGNQGSSPVPTGLYASPKKGKTFQPECSICNMKFKSLEKFSQHCNDFHIFKCHRCSEKWSSQELLQKHLWDAHRSDTDECEICKQKIKIGRPYIRHMRNSHLKKNSVVLKRLDPKIVEEDNKRWEIRKAQIDKERAEEAAKKAEEASKQAANRAAQRSAQSTVQVTPGKKKASEVICLDSDEEEAPPAKKPALGEGGEGDNVPPKQEKGETQQQDKKDEGDDSEAKISSEVLEVDGEKIVIEQQDEADTSNNSGKEEDPAEAQEEEDAQDTGERTDAQREEVQEISSDVEMIEDNDKSATGGENDDDDDENSAERANSPDGEDNKSSGNVMEISDS